MSGTESPVTPDTPRSSVSLGSNTPRIYGNESLSNRISQFKSSVEKNATKLKQNSFSGSFERSSLRGKLDKYDPSYGKPVPGSKTEARGIKAGENIEDEIRMLCDVLKEHGKAADHNSTDYIAAMTFGELFGLYQVISNKVVGILLRARKHGLLDFEGEMLYQRRDDDKIIKLIKLPEKR